MEYRGFGAKISDGEQSGVEITVAFSDEIQPVEEQKRRFCIGAGTFAGIFDGLGPNGGQAASEVANYCNKEMSAIDVENGEIVHMVDDVRAYLRSILWDADTALNSTYNRGAEYPETGVNAALAHVVRNTEESESKRVLVVGCVGDCVVLRRRDEGSKSRVEQINIVEHRDLWRIAQEDEGAARYLQGKMFNMRDPTAPHHSKHLKSLYGGLNARQPSLGATPSYRKDMPKINVHMYEANDVHAGDQVLLLTSGFRTLTGKCIEDTWNNTQQTNNTALALTEEVCRKNAQKDPRAVHSDVAVIHMKF